MTMNPTSGSESVFAVLYTIITLEFFKKTLESSDDHTQIKAQ